MSIYISNLIISFVKVISFSLYSENCWIFLSIRYVAQCNLGDSSSIGKFILIWVGKFILIWVWKFILIWVVHVPGKDIDCGVAMLRIIRHFGWNMSSVNLTQLCDKQCLQQRECTNLGRNGYKLLNTRSGCAMIQITTIAWQILHQIDKQNRGSQLGCMLVYTTNSLVILYLNLNFILK